MKTKFLISVFLVALIGSLSALWIHAHWMAQYTTIKSQVFSDNPNSKLVALSKNSGDPAHFSTAAEKALPCVVHIKTTSTANNLSYDPFTEFFFGYQGKPAPQIQQGSGSGVIISADGYVVTNNHVINGSDKIDVTLNDKRHFEAEVIGVDASTDIALLKLKAQDLPFISYGNSDAVRIGEWVLAVGNPFNLYNTVTAGIISAKGRNNIINTNQRAIESFIQTDAAVNPGNSGGALVNINGELIGINTAIASNNGAYQGYAFAVPVNIVKKIVRDLAEFGTVQRAYLGVNIQDIDAKFAEDKNLSRLKGVYVNGLFQGGSADVSGIKTGDVIIRIEDADVNTVSELQEQISRYRPGDVIKVNLIREKKEIQLSVTLKTLDNTTQLSKTGSSKAVFDELGIECQELDSETLKAMKLQNGIQVYKLKPGKLTQIGIQKGFVITAIDRKKIESLEDLKAALQFKKGMITLEGAYPNGMRATYSFPL
jgi:serine protease Do